MWDFRLDLAECIGHLAVMRKRNVITLAAAIVAVLGLMWCGVASQPPDPVYGGRPLSYWADPSAWTSIWVKFPPPPLDSNALPYLVDALKKKDGPLRRSYNDLWPHLPGWMQEHLPIPRYLSNVRWESCHLLSTFGVRAQSAIPELRRMLREDEYWQVRLAAAFALGKIARRDDKPVVEALVAAATKDKDTHVRGQAAHALVRIDPEAADKAGVTKTAWSAWPDE